jgi:hypothetical protein
LVLIFIAKTTSFSILKERDCSKEEQTKRQANALGLQRNTKVELNLVSVNCYMWPPVMWPEDLGIRRQKRSHVAHSDGWEHVVDLDAWVNLTGTAPTSGPVWQQADRFEEDGTPPAQ